MKRTNRISQQAAEKFYAEVFTLCHHADASEGRSVAIGSSDAVSTVFNIQTPHGLLEVSVCRPEWIVSLGRSIAMRFVSSEKVPCSVGLHAVDALTGKWNITEGLFNGPDAVIAELATRLDCAQGKQLALA